MKAVLKWLVILVILAALGGGGFWGYKKFIAKENQVQFTTETVQRTDLASSISATGTVEPEELVNVGAQVGGMITVFGADTDGKPVDYGSHVTAGSVLARIDDALYEASFREAQAQKQLAEAQVMSATANIEQAKAKFLLATNNWNRASELYPKNALSRSDYDNYNAEYHTAKAAISVSEASLAQGQAQLAVANASLDRAVRNLGYCVINSPVDGVIIDRRVSIGQTVVSSMNAPSLFLIAKDLRKMQVWVSVNEADIGSIRVGMKSTFTVDAFPERVFEGVVHKIRLNATMSQNVVTYVVEVSTDNSDGKLFPYLTASVKFIREERKGVLAVSNAALRYTPDASLVPLEDRDALNAEAAPAAAPAANRARRGGGEGGGGEGGQVREGGESQRRSGNGERRSGSRRRSSTEGTVWVRDGEKIRPVKIRVGINDGISSEVLSGELEEGMEVISGSRIITPEEQKTQASAGSPFVPKPPQRRR